MRGIRWKWIVAAGCLAEATVFAVFFLLLFAATAAGVPGIARPMGTLDYIDALVSSFVTVFFFTLWVGRRIESAFVLHGVLIGMFGILLVFSLKFYPFVYLMTASALGSISPSVEEAAESLGAGPWSRFFRVTLPLVFPAVSSGALLAFVLSIADFGTPSIASFLWPATVRRKMRASRFSSRFRSVKQPSARP